MNLVILGATTRAAAWSALRAGLVPFAADLFADRDLKAVARSVHVEMQTFPDNLAAAAETFPEAPWIYTGPIENHPALVERVSRSRTLWGIDAAALSRVRDPIEVARVLGIAGHAVPEVRLSDPSGLPCDGSWLRKPIASAGGVGVRRYFGDQSEPFLGSYYQQHVAGESISALFMGTHRSTWLAGVTRQLLGRGDDPFAYRGSVGPYALPQCVIERIGSIGETVRAGFGLMGLFGIDLIVDAEGMPWPIEINPRYTASVEVLELACEVSLLDAHRRACNRELMLRLMLGPLNGRRFIGKEVVYASHDGVFERGMAVPDWSPTDPWRMPEYADLPEPGTPFRTGDPVLTLYASGLSLESCTEALRERRARVGI